MTRNEEWNQNRYFFRNARRLAYNDNVNLIQIIDHYKTYLNLESDKLNIIKYGEAVVVVKKTGS